MPVSSTSRAKHLTTHGLGKHYTSPKKLRDKRKSGKVVLPLGNATKHRLLLQKLDRLQRKQPSDVSMPPDEPGEWEDLDPIPVDPTVLDADIHEALHAPGPQVQTTDKGSKTKLSASSSLRLHASWAEVLPGLVAPLISYISGSIASVVSPVNDLHSRCIESCETKHIKILCLYFDREYPLDTVYHFLITNCQTFAP
jgi:hypothetical protein